ncbi:dephospho-CoA kinase [Dietzia sp. SLG310A2-38A2]|uniref:dephospho-CoA kinase n=1 Tax=Dietzia sp. SLG310A2-38A2 TaxID=1630643 RepID=UPI0015FA57A6|nr:dephospho-CoA kinase [Dietzia sp. SLG310A2-38A2]MBB1030823.1 dephospho-CoA kinase [Dietzia sp. SLG310A2-38A2]
MLMVGLTGGIGAGKSTVTTVLAEAGAVIVDADRIAREIVEPGTPGLAMLVAEFGDDIVGPDGALDRAALAARAFVDAERTAALNAITHPLIGERTAELFGSAPDDAIVVHDMPLLVEGGMTPAYHLVIVVDTPAEIRLRRLVEQRGMPADDARARMSRQATDEARRAEADVLIDNSGDREPVRDIVQMLVELRLQPFEHNLRTGTPVVGDRTVVPFRPEWAAEAARATARLRHVLGDVAARVDHVGPTAVDGLDAPDIVDLQVTVRNEAAVERALALLTGAGYVRDRSAERPLLHWCDPARPLEVSILAEDDPEHEFALLMAEAIGSDPSARVEYSEILRRADREETREWERTRCEVSDR